jgi:hypothetical protein
MEPPSHATEPAAAKRILFSDSIAVERMEWLMQEGQTLPMERIFELMGQENVPEVTIQRAFEEWTGHGHEKCVLGVTDISGGDYIIEIKGWKAWKEAVGQLLVYRTCRTACRKIIVFFGKTPSIDWVAEVFTSLSEYNIFPICCPLGVDIHRVDLPNLKKEPKKPPSPSRKYYPPTSPLAAASQLAAVPSTPGTVPSPTTAPSAPGTDSLEKAFANVQTVLRQLEEISPDDPVIAATKRAYLIKVLHETELVVGEQCSKSGKDKGEKESLQQFFDQRVAREGTINSTELYDVYCEFAESQHLQAVSINDFSAFMISKGIQKKRMPSGMFYDASVIPFDQSTQRVRSQVEGSCSDKEHHSQSAGSSSTAKPAPIAKPIIPEGSPIHHLSILLDYLSKLRDPKDMREYNDISGKLCQLVMKTKEAIEGSRQVKSERAQRDVGLKKFVLERVLLTGRTQSSVLYNAYKIFVAELGMNPVSTADFAYCMVSIGAKKPTSCSTCFYKASLAPILPDSRSDADAQIALGRVEKALPSNCSQWPIDRVSTI